MDPADDVFDFPCPPPPRPPPPPPMPPGMKDDKYKTNRTDGGSTPKLAISNVVSLCKSRDSDAALLHEEYDVSDVATNELEEDENAGDESPEGPNDVPLVDLLQSPKKPTEFDKKKRVIAVQLKSGIRYVVEGGLSGEFSREIAEREAKESSLPGAKDPPPAKEVQLPCPYCDYRCQRASKMQDHVNRTHLKIKPYRCKACAYGTTTPNLLQKHVAAKHGKNNVSAKDNDVKKGRENCEKPEQGVKNDGKESTNDVKVTKSEVGGARRKEKKEANGAKLRRSKRYSKSSTDDDDDEPNTFKTASTSKKAPVTTKKAEVSVKERIKRTLGSQNSNEKNRTEPKDNDGKSPPKIIKIKTTPTLYKCAKCDFAALSAGQVSRHQLRMHAAKDAQGGGVKSGIRKCPECSFSILSGESVVALQKHMKTVHSRTEGDHQCPRCDFETPELVLLARHVRTRHHGDDTEPKFKCGLCSYRAYEACMVEKHKETVHLKAETCASCDYATASREVMLRHFQKRHVGDKSPKFKCTDCNYATFEATQLSSHDRECSRQQQPVMPAIRAKDMVCPYCDFKTPVSTRLTNHIKGVHYDLCDFKCDECDFTSSRAYILRQHMKIKHVDSTMFLKDTALTTLCAKEMVNPKYSFAQGLVKK